MITELHDQRDAIVALCQRFGVARLAVFGSAVTDQFDPLSSDVDFRVVFERPAGMSHFDAYFGLKEGLEALLERPVDLVTPAALQNPYVARSIARTQRDLYAA